MGIARKIGCSLIGWDEKILSQCGEASSRQFRKLVSAVFIMMVLWGTIGYCFTTNYIKVDSFLFRVAVSMVFMAIIVCIERVIILTVGKAKVMGAIRLLLALVMATLGSTVFDQMIFRNDIKDQLMVNREEMVQEIVKKRIVVIDDRIAEIGHQMDSLSIVIETTSKELLARPVIKSINVSTEKKNTGRVDESGKPIMEVTTKTDQVTTANPLASKLETDQDIYTNYMNQIDDLNRSKLTIQDDVADEVMKRDPGFIEELQATVQVVSKSGWTIAFYTLMFLFLLFLETFVVSIKMADTKCDYDLVVEHQLRIKEMQLRAAEEEMTDMYVTKQLKNQQNLSVD